MSDKKAPARKVSRDANAVRDERRKQSPPEPLPFKNAPGSFELESHRAVPDAGWEAVYYELYRRTESRIKDARDALNSLSWYLGDKPESHGVTLQHALKMLRKAVEP